MSNENRQYMEDAEDEGLKAVMGGKFKDLSNTTSDLNTAEQLRPAKKHPEKDDVKETNRQRREREKLKRETTEKVNAYMRGEKSKETENVPNGKRCGKYKKKNKKK